MIDPNLLAIDHGPDGATAWFSLDRAYRYRLSRRWRTHGPSLIYVMLDPSTADAFVLDPTITRCVNFARRWNRFSGIEVLNLFALRSTNPRAMDAHEDPVGTLNDEVIRDVACTLARYGSPVAAAWGADRLVPTRAPAVERLLADLGVELWRLGEPTKAGHPRHPLYLRSDTPIVPHRKD